MEYVELDDALQCRRYCWTVDSNHICRFSILEPKERSESKLIRKRSKAYSQRIVCLISIARRKEGQSVNIDQTIVQVTFQEDRLLLLFL